MAKVELLSSDRILVVLDTTMREVILDDKRGTKLRMPYGDLLRASATMFSYAVPKDSSDPSTTANAEQLICGECNQPAPYLSMSVWKGKPVCPSCRLGY